MTRTMKRIKLPISNTFRSSVLDMREVTKRLTCGETVHFENPDFGKGSAELEIASDNGAQIVYATVNIENKLDEILALYFFGAGQGLNERKSFFVNQVLQSSRFDFVFKRELTNNVVNELELLEGKDKDDLQKNLKRIMDWRNAFAHGSFECDYLHVIHLKYFSGGRKHIDLNDDYWGEVEKCFNDTISLLKKAEEILQKSLSNNCCNNQNS